MEEKRAPDLLKEGFSYQHTFVLLSNYNKYKHIFMIPQLNSAWQGLE